MTFSTCVRSHALVAVDERMVLRQAFPECGGFLDQILRSIHSADAPAPTQVRPGPEVPSSRQIVRSGVHERIALPQSWDSTSLSQAAQEFRVLIDELINSRKERVVLPWRAALQIFDELQNDSLLLWRQTVDDGGQLLGWPNALI